MLKPPFKFSPDIRHGRRGAPSRGEARNRREKTQVGGKRNGSFEMAGVECASLGNAPVTGDAFFELGIMYAVGRDVAADLAAAHKWFNLAAMRGNREATRWRRRSPIRCPRARSPRRNAQRARGSSTRHDFRRGRGGFKPAISRKRAEIGGEDGIRTHHTALTV